MISEKIIQNAAQIRASFESAKPFKHLCLDNFLEVEAAEQALADFPAFDQKKAINELGEVGRKAVHSNLSEISPFYARFYDYLFSRDFLDIMSNITGIADLIGDPTMYGGGTHENLHGQELDPHVDFNYVAGGAAHRRVNLLIYLNKVWDSAWGGDIEIHSNPRDPDVNEIKSYRVDFNRAVMFVTNEVSWHGFPRIQLPEPLRDTISRKCISIYLYTRSLPTDEIAGTHGTFYVQRPLDQRFKAGYTLKQGDIAELNYGYRSRDRYIELYQNQEERFGREKTGLENYIKELTERVRLPVIGYALQVQRLEGTIWPDGWASKMFKMEMRAVRNLKEIELQGHLAESDPHQKHAFRLTVNETEKTLDVSGKTSFVLKIPVSIREGETFKIAVTCDVDFNPKKLGFGDDARDLAYLIGSVRFE